MSLFGVGEPLHALQVALMTVRRRLGGTQALIYPSAPRNMRKSALARQFAEARVSLYGVGHARVMMPNPIRSACRVSLYRVGLTSRLFPRQASLGCCLRPRPVPLQSGSARYAVEPSKTFYKPRYACRG